MTEPDTVTVGMTWIFMEDWEAIKALCSDFSTLTYQGWIEQHTKWMMQTPPGTILVAVRPDKLAEWLQREGKMFAVSEDRARFITDLMAAGTAEIVEPSSRVRDEKEHVVSVDEDIAAALTGLIRDHLPHDRFITMVEIARRIMDAVKSKGDLRGAVLWGFKKERLKRHQLENLSSQIATSIEITLSVYAGAGRSIEQFGDYVERCVASMLLVIDCQEKPATYICTEKFKADFYRKVTRVYNMPYDQWLAAHLNNPQKL